MYKDRNMGGKERLSETERSFSDELAEISKSVHTHIFSPIDMKPLYGETNAKIRKDILGFGNDYHDIMHLYENGDVDSKFDEFSKDFKNQLEILCEKIKHYTNDEKYRDSELVRKLVEGMFKLNGKFYNSYKDLKQSELLEAFPIILGKSLLYSSMKDNGTIYNDMSYYGETKKEKEIREKYEPKIDQLKRLWISVYRPLMQLVNKELDDLLSNKDEEAFKAGLKRSYIGEYIKGVEYGEKFSRSYSILKDKKEKLGNQLSELEECFDEDGNLKDEAKIPNLDDIGILEISIHNKRRYNEEQLKAKVKEKVARCIDGVKNLAGAIKPFNSKKE